MGKSAKIRHQRRRRAIKSGRRPAEILQAQEKRQAQLAADTVLFKHHAELRALATAATEARVAPLRKGRRAPVLRQAPAAAPSQS
jgi:hypothetical protein